MKLELAAVHVRDTRQRSVYSERQDWSRASIREARKQTNAGVIVYYIRSSSSSSSYASLFIVYTQYYIHVDAEEGM